MNPPATFWKDLLRVGRKELLYLTVGIAATSILHKLYVISTKIWESKNAINEIKFVKNTNKLCKAHVYHNIICTPWKRTDETLECSNAILKWMIEFFDNTKESLDVAIYLVTCVEFREAILRAHHRGVRVRIISDCTMATGSGSAIPTFISEGIPVRMHDSKHMMHRKSAIADEKIILMGSGNWTMQALAGNWDGWIKTNDKKIVRGYVDAFNYHWCKTNLLEPTLKQLELLVVHK